MQPPDASKTHARVADLFGFRNTGVLVNESGSLGIARDYSRVQLARLRDRCNSKAIDAAIQAAAVFNATGRLINTQLIPRGMLTLDGLAESAASLNRMIQATHLSLNLRLSAKMTHRHSFEVTHIESMI